MREQSGNRYATMVLGILDAGNKSFDYVNGGHNTPLMRRKDAGGSISVDEMDQGGRSSEFLPEANTRVAIWHFMKMTCRRCTRIGVAEAQKYP
jgi:serine phosphatase RsbU (regulator of sigma subunit)